MSSLSVTRPPAMAGLDWVKAGVRLFAASPVPWMGMSAAVFLMAYGLHLVPVAGGAVLEILSPFVVAAYMAAAEAAEKNEPTGLIHIGAGYFRGRNALLAVGVAYWLVSLLVWQLVGAIGGDAVDQLLAQAANPQVLSPEEAQAIVSQAGPAILLGALLLTPMLMATWFAPALALFEDFPPGKALFWSLWACLVNWRPFFVYGLLLTLMTLVALVIPFGLGLLVLIPVAMTSTYAAYRGQFVARPGTDPGDAPMNLPDGES